MDAESRQAVIEREIRARLSPQPGDPLYIYLADLLLAVKKIATSEAVKILDYGAGLAPYRSLFPRGEYRTADVGSALTIRDGLIGTPARNEAFATPDYIISPDGRVPETSNIFDFVLSTQVLEHVADSQLHVSECFRLLS